ncbi:hypothetical protein NDU88_010534 [Pleurodeles waltl]|uniref:Uncharacterized protein n=1 Tax=Pleurodeles waltl TaxID=8319 RepID=A0AAV7S1J8_PLEWA|nr:hypothetical protein NDU88_010534 [Pleurodeles waltl]
MLTVGEVSSGADKPLLQSPGHHLPECMLEQSWSELKKRCRRGVGLEHVHMQERGASGAVGQKGSLASGCLRTRIMTTAGLELHRRGGQGRPQGSHLVQQALRACPGLAHGRHSRSERWCPREAAIMLRLSGPWQGR